MNCEFKRIDIWHMSAGNTSICWELSADFFPSGRLHFYVDFGWPGTDTWIALNSEPIVDYCCFIDTCQRNWEQLAQHYYRVRLLLPDDPSCPVYTSQPVTALGRLDRTDWLRARDIVRKEHLQQRKKEGVAGFLLKRKKFGIACPTCLDWDTKEVTDSNCPICYGTGITGGYYPGSVYYMTLGGQWQRRLNVGEPPRGVFSDINTTARCIMYPVIDTKDVWVRADNDARYVIDSYQVAAELRGLPLVALAQIKLAPATDVIYSIPIEATPSSSSSTAEPVACDVRKGLDSSYEDW